MKTKNPGIVGLSVLLYVFVSFGGAFAAAQEASKAGPVKADWTAEDILLSESASDWKISPDGKWAVWVKTRMDKDKNGEIANLFLTNLRPRKRSSLLAARK